MALHKFLKSRHTWIFVLLGFVIYDLALGWWGTVPPRRPKNIPPASVFIVAPEDGFIVPLPKHGDWLYCWLDAIRNTDRCKMEDIDGQLEYEGYFSPSDGPASIGQNDLEIDRKATGNRWDWVYFHEQIIPIIHLRNGKILIPNEALDEARKELQENHR